MSLLQGLLGFGAGFTGSIAEQKKADLEAQRQANLARLKAQYQGEVKMEQARIGSEMLLSNDPAVRLQGRIFTGVNPSEPTKPEFVNFIDPNNPDAPVMSVDTTTQAGAARARALAEQGYVRAGTASLDQPELKGPMVRVSGPGIEPFVTQEDDPRVARIATQNPEARIDLLSPQERTDFAGRKIISRGGIDYVRMPDGTERRLSDIEGRTGALPSETQAQGTEGLSPAELPPGDYIRLATGPLQAVQRFGLNLPGLGDVLGMFAEDGKEAVGAAQTRATRSFEMARRNLALAYRYNASRTSNLDIQTAEKLFPRFGLLSTDVGTYNQALAVRDSIKQDIITNQRIARVDLPASEMATQKARDEARMFLSNIQNVLPALDSYINGYELTEVKIPIGNRKRQLIDLPYEVLSDPEKVPASAFANLSDRDKELVKIWFNYNGWQF